ncbi:hypothetical protein HKCCE3408_05085 [Rhodobacterales bacterium HKCCE3408]|nr:hypothetical protein [Rhodobacterales bacterium HKCCE3408]
MSSNKIPEIQRPAIFTRLSPRPAIWQLAADEENWLLFAVSTPNQKKNGKRDKRPVVSDRPYIICDRKKAATMTLDVAVKRLRFFREEGDLTRWNRKHEERRRERLSELEKPPLIPFDFAGLALGYFPREGSALIGLDFDEVVVDGRIEDFELAALVEDSPAYVEISTSGSGVRVVMPRREGDETHHAGERNGVGLFVSSRGAAFAITGNEVKGNG